MKLSRILMIVTLLLPLALLASGAEGGSYYKMTGRENDFVPRLFNFIIFAALLYYLISKPIKGYFRARKESIAEKLKEIEKLLQESKERKKEAEHKLEESRKKAQEIIIDAKAEAKLLSQNIAASTQEEIAILQKQIEEKMAIEEKKVLRETVEKVLEENITLDDISLDPSKVIEIIEKKVA